MTYKYKGLVEPLRELSGMKEMISQLEVKSVNAFGNNVGIKVTNMVDACKGHFIYGVSEFVNLPSVIITYDEVSTKRIFEDMEALKGKGKVYTYPSRDILFYNADVHSMDITSARIRVIEALNNEEDITLIIPVQALLNPLSPKATWQSYTTTVKVGEIINITALQNKLVQIGYERVGRVEGIGQFAVRGGIMDIYPPTMDEPYRIELWDDEVDSIRSFNVQTQRSIEKVEELLIVPNQEIVFSPSVLRDAVPAIKEDLKKIVSKLQEEGKRESAEKIKEQVNEAIEQIQNDISPKGLELYVPYTELETVSILDYLPKHTIIFIDEPVKVKDKSERTLFEYRESMKDRLEYGHILPKQVELIFEYEAISQRIEDFKKVYLMKFDSSEEQLPISLTMSLNVHEHSNVYRNIEILEEDLKKWKEDKERVMILCGMRAKAQRLSDALEERGLLVSNTENPEEEVQPGQVLIYKGALERGFYYKDLNWHIVADKDLFGQDKKARKSKKKFSGAKIQSFLELSPGDYVVHEMHGIGVFKGIEQIVFEGISRDNLKIEYADNNILYVNINQMDMVQKYVGAEGKAPKLSKLGGSEWRKSKAKVKSAIKDIAKDLIKLYGQRQYNRGFKYDPDNVWQREFEELFPYEETDDQLEAIEDVKKDMESDKIMDRLICGDVGYGKTEVAIRAAFKAVQSGKQVAYLVPTTILAQQHYKRFAERMADYPINVELLSRFRTAKQVKQTIEGLASGRVDIVVGTHRLLSKDVKFKDLGLVIIDEEQRFGVTHKEKLKQMRTQVDVMNLTATPIPRTLHMSLIGIRDMSVLEEAPLERKPVQTYVIEYSEDFIKDAINRELGRGGQVYYLHNQVKNIEDEAMKIQRLVPNARVSFAHGQMSERELEKIMMEFINQEIDVLVCTTIIETGLDIPNANTIIMNDADRMGLSQLYQLRGRVGRSNKMGYAYLMYQKNKVLKEIAEKRLQAIKQFTELGAGFKIAMRDLEIRGAGNLLGAQQHGHMESIGYDLYCKMLSEVVNEEKGEITEEEFETTIEIKINAYIPGGYIPDEVQKLDIYKKIASIHTESEYMDIGEEIEDRYGNIPQSVYNLLDIAMIKAMAHDLYMTLVSENQKIVTFKFKEDAPLNAAVIPEIVAAYRGGMKFVAGKEPMIKIAVQDIPKKELLAYIKNVLRELKKLKSDN